MITKQKIEYMIQTLQIALDELQYREEYKEKENKLEDGGYHHWFYNQNRTPNLTLIHENLKSVGRYSRIVEKEIPTIYSR